MEIFKFFNSAPGDARTYQAADFADYFGSVLSTGLLHTNEVPGMSVTVEAGTLNTVVNAGKAIMKGHLYENTAPLTLSHSIPEATLDRIDRIVLRLDLRNAERNIKLHVKQGVSSASPVAPSLQRDNFIYELSLAQVRVRANTASLRVSDLLDERLNENLCGVVYSLISIPTDQFQLYITARTAELGVEAEQFEQQLIQNLADYEQEYQEWFADLKASGFASASEFAAHKADDTSHVRYGSASGTNSKIVTLNPAPTSLVEGFALSFKNTVANTGTSTLNVNGLGAKPIVKSNGIAVASGNLKAGSIYTVRYDGTSFILQGEGGEYGTAVAGDVLTGKTIGTESGIVEGTLVLNELVVSPGDQVLLASPNEVSLTNSSFIKVKEIISNFDAGTVRLKFEIKIISNNTVYAQIYKNGVAVGTLRSSTSNLYTAFSEDIVFSKGDLIQLYARTFTASSSVQVRNFQISVAKNPHGTVNL